MYISIALNNAVILLIEILLKVSMKHEDFSRQPLGIVFPFASTRFGHLNLVSQYCSSMHHSICYYKNRRDDTTKSFLS